MNQSVDMKRNRSEFYAYLFSFVNLVNASVPWQNDDFLIMVRLLIHFISAAIVLLSSFE